MLVSILSIFILCVASLYPERINYFTATVGPIGITAIDLENEIRKLRKSRVPIKRPRTIAHLALDSLIEQAIIEYTAKNEAITVSEVRIDNEIKREIKTKGIGSEKKLRKQLKQFSIKWKDFRKNIYRKIMTRRVVQQKIKLSLPSQKEIENFYAKKSQKFSYKYYYRLIAVPFKAGNTQDELRANKIIVQAQKMAKKNFARAARLYSKHPSKKNGGLIGWQKLNEITLINPQLPALIQQSPLNLVSQEYPLGNTYFVVKVEKKRKARLSELKELITNILYGQKQQQKFSEWLLEERRRLAVKILLKGYRKP